MRKTRTHRIHLKTYNQHSYLEKKILFSSLNQQKFIDENLSESASQYQPDTLSKLITPPQKYTIFIVTQ
jgi:hypothetical protein